MTGPVFLGIDRSTCPHTYPITRDGRCHGCGTLDPGRRTSLGEAIDDARDLTEGAQREQRAHHARRLAAFLNNKAQVLANISTEIEESASEEDTTSPSRERAVELRSVARALADLAATFRA